ncbi:hypothetical protein AcW1_004336 [Taiwanofungus camphoratus]|nr:hypothetical protein AcW1_004336 [Antrodia cinnamomea]
MKRTYDYSFVEDSDNITSAVDARSFQPPQTATPATHRSIGIYTTVPFNAYVNENAPSVDGAPVLEFRVPLLAGAISLTSDLQSNAGLVQANIQLTGLGICYEAPFGTAAASASALVSTVSCPIADNLGALAEFGSDNLSLHDIFHIDSPDLRRTDDGEDLYRSDDILGSSAAYSECPTADYITHSPPPSSLPSLSFGSGSEGSSMDDLSLSQAKKPVDILGMHSPTLHQGNHTLAKSEPLVGLFADVNMRELALKQEVPVPGVNPAEIMGDSLYVRTQESVALEDGDNAGLHHDLSPAPDNEIDPASELDASTNFSDEAISAIVSLLSTSKREEDTSESPTFTSVSVRPSDLYHAACLHVQPPLPTRSSTFDAALASVPFVSPGLPASQTPGRPPLVDMNLPQVSANLFPEQTAGPYIQPQSPVLNAHLGVELEDLRRRAEEFRRNNPGIELDKTWLQAYAGRLSQRGELIEEYRCYVVGCSQRNKRRDHILVHVGSHVEHRPFQCGFCGMRFLRKNECKRHESSHAGRKPFSCPICAPFQDRSFVRQDLLKRHMRVTHGVQPESAAERRKRARAMMEENYWP